MNPVNPKYLNQLIDLRLMFYAAEKEKKEKRKTEDGCLAFANDKVWEVVYQYINGEISEAIPEERLAKEIPPQFPIWEHRINCLLHCIRLNNKISKQIYAGQ